MKRSRRAAFLFGVALPLAVFAPSVRAADRASECADHAEQSQILRDERKLVEARALMVSCAQLECPAVVRGSCTEWLAELDKRVPSIVVSAKDAEGRDLTNVRVTVDGKKAPDGISSSAVRLNPGEHVLRYELDGYRAAEEKAVLREGEGLRVLRVTLAHDAPFLAPTPAPVSAAPLPGRAVSPFVFVLGGAAIVAAGFFTYFGLSGAAEYRRLEGQCAPHCASSDLDGVRSRFLVADVALVTSLVSLGGAAAVFFFGSPRVEGAR